MYNYPMLVVGKEFVNGYGYPKILEQERYVICETAEDVEKTVDFFKTKGPRTAEILVYTLVKSIKSHAWVETSHV